MTPDAPQSVRVRRGPPGPRSPTPAPVVAPRATSAPRADPNTPTRFRAPASWTVTHTMQQLVVLAIMGPSLLLATNGAPLIQAALVHLPELPLGVAFVPAGVYAPLILPLLLGTPLTLSRHRAPLLLFIALIITILVASVLEVSRLNWLAFFSGVAFRIDSGPVPLVRTIAGLITLLLAMALLAHQSIRLSTLYLAARGIAIEDLRRVRSGLMGLERALLVGAGIGGLALTIIASISLSVTEGAPEAADGVTAPLAWTLLLVAGLMVAVGLSLWDLRSARRA